MGKSYIIYRKFGAVNVYFDELWDGQDRYFNPTDIELLSWETEGGSGYFETTQTGFEAIGGGEYQDTYKICGFMEETNMDSLSKILLIGAYYNNNGIVSNVNWFLNGTIVSDMGTFTYDGLESHTAINIPWHSQVYGGSGNNVHLNFNFPIFKTQNDRDAYILSGTINNVWNADDGYDLNETKYYYIYNKQQQGTLFNGKITPTSATPSWHSLRFSANKAPVLYFDDDDFELKINAPLIVASKAVSGPGYIIDNIPEESWTEGVLEYSGPFYGTLPAKINYTGELPENGTYMYGAECNTNIYIFKTKAAADTAIETGDYSAAENAYDINYGNTHLPVSVGNEESATTFGNGYGTSPFVSSYIMTKNNVLNVANAFYSNDTTLIDNIKKGLELFGANPYDAVCGLSWFPFDLNTVANASGQNYIYFGSYQYTGITADKVINLKTSGYVNAGSVYIAPLFSSYRDFEPYCQLSVYLPYSGWHELDIAKYYKKTVNIRYYIDIYTNTFACALTIDNQICDIFNGNIGVSLPLSGTNMSEYGNSMLRAVLGTVGSTAGGAISGAMLGGGVPGAVIGATVGGFAGIAKGTFEMAQKGQPKDHLQVKGAFSGASSSYMPQYVIFRYDVHDLIVPDNLTNLYGRPSSASGKVGSFAGYLKCDTVKLNTGRMTDAEINETLALLKQGIFV